MAEGGFTTPDLNLGIYRFLGITDYIPKAVIGRGSNNEVSEVIANNLPWTDNCADAIAGNMTRLILRVDRKKIPSIMILKELSLMSLMHAKGVGPRLYGARVKFGMFDTRFASVESIMEKFDMDLHVALRDRVDFPLDLAEEMLASHLEQLASMNYICVDIKPGNVVINLPDEASGGGFELKLIDFDVGFCGEDILISDEDYAILARGNAQPVMDRLKREWERMNAHDDSFDPQVKHGFMVLLMRMHIIITSAGRSPLLRVTLDDMVDMDARTLNGISYDFYSYWLAEDIFMVQHMIRHYFYNGLNEIYRGPINFERVLMTTLSM